MPECWIGLGANLGDARAALDAAWSMLRDHSQVEVRHRSGLYRTAPVGANAGEAFVNAVCCVSTTLTPLALLDELQSIERNLGRTRELHWGPRTLDLDLLFFGGQVVAEPRLTVPHPAAWYRRFVIDPLVEIAPTFRHPVLDRTIEELRQHLRVRPLSVAFGDTWTSLVAHLQQEVASRFPSARLISLGASDASSVAHVRVHPDDSEPPWSTSRGEFVADLRAAPGDLARRVIDFLTAVLDEPQRIGDW